MAEAEAQAKTDLIRYHTDNGIAFLTLNDPPANTYSYAMMQALDEAILKARMDETVQVIVITGNGEKFFCAGADIAMLSNVTPTFKYYFCLHANETLNRLEQTPKLVIAAINGHCVGGGLEVAMAADIRLARKDAGKMGLPEVSLGVLPGTGGTQRLLRLIGKPKAIELMATGQLFDFERGAELGIVTGSSKQPLRKLSWSKWWNMRGSSPPRIRRRRQSERLSAAYRPAGRFHLKQHSH